LEIIIVRATTVQRRTGVRGITRMAAETELLTRLAFDAGRLLAEYPPRLRHPNKRRVFDIAFASGRPASGRVEYTRWWAMSLPAVLKPSAALDVRVHEDVYDYAPVGPPDKTLEWYVNFADPQLFFAYGSGLFAQDEMQVAEHPVLGSLREALVAKGEKAVTVEGRIPTPVLVRDAERRVTVATNPDAGAGRPDGLYGNRFAAASEETVARATAAVDPPTLTNLIAMAAPQGGSGRYDWDDIDHVLVTAYSGFRAASIEMRAALAGVGAARTVIHTGFWGCGAFGGDRVLMTLLQLLAAQLAEVDVVAFHCVHTNGRPPVERALALLGELIRPAPARRTWRWLSRAGNDEEQSSVRVRDVEQRISEMGFEWGVSDGN
jgi:hypothetical protein